MDSNYKSTPLYKWICGCFWILMAIYLPTYFMTRYMNEEDKYGEFLHVFYTMWVLPTFQTSWESYLLTPAQLEAYLTQGIEPKKTLNGSSLFTKDPNGNYFILFRFKCNRFRTRTYAANIKCYVEGCDFPLDLCVYPGLKHLKYEFKDHIIPVHVDPNKVKWKPRLSIQWTHMARI